MRTFVIRENTLMFSFILIISLFNVIGSWLWLWPPIQNASTRKEAPARTDAGGFTYCSLFSLLI